jgi:ribosomal protein S19
MNRSSWKGKFLDKHILNLDQKKKDKNIKIWSRRSTIISSLVNKFVFIHNGKEFKKILITSEKVGLKFGEFVFTRKFTKKKTVSNKNTKGLKK